MVWTLRTRNGYIGYSSGSTGTVTVDGTGSTWANSSDLYVGNPGTGTLNITNGGEVSVTGTTSVGSAGRINFGTTGGTLTSGTLLGSLTKFTGTGTINAYGLISDIDLLFDATHAASRSILLNTSSDQNVTLNLDLTGTTTTGDLGIGNTGSGSMGIQEAVNIKTRNGYIGYSPGSTGTVTVSDAGSSWTNSCNLYVGYAGNGSLAISHGATVTDTNGYIGRSDFSYYGLGTTGTVTVDGTGSTWANSNNLYVGYLCNGSLAISHGATVTSTNGYIGRNDFFYSVSANTGAVTVDGTGSTWANSSNIYVGYAGNGSLTISHGATVTSTNGYIGRTNSSYYGLATTGTVTVDGPGSAWNNSDKLFVGGEGYYSNNNGYLSITDGATVTSTSGIIGNTSYSTGTVTVDGEGSTWANSNNLYVGNSGTGLLTISNKGLVSIGGILNIDSDSDGDGFVHMASGGMLALKGDGDGSISEFLSLVSGTDAICYWDQTASSWANITLARKDMNYTLKYLTDGDLTGYTVLTYFGTPISGDANFDGAIDVSDLGILASNYGLTGGVTWAMGDFNLDGKIDVSDLGILAANYGGSGVTPAVPEPMTLSLLAFAGFVGILRRR